jgi:hypothetical protein
MTQEENEPPPRIGVYWLKEPDYPAALEIFEDGNTMPRTWAKWLKMAEEMERGLKAYGHAVERVTIDPNIFSDWCAAHGTTPGRQGRKMFMAAAIIEKYGEPD